ncbi:uncharacterized protein [Dermacentor albipictus]|uniref:uncharacterized protein isoform X6 n=1 Tax=Dermacentor albipictus TaxID=60249 RepID=UPI0038FC340E
MNRRSGTRALAENSETMSEPVLRNDDFSGVNNQQQVVLANNAANHESPWKTFLCATSAFVAFTIATAVILFYFRRSPAVRSLVKFGTSTPGGGGRHGPADGVRRGRRLPGRGAPGVRLGRLRPRLPLRQRLRGRRQRLLREPLAARGAVRRPHALRQAHQHGVRPVPQAAALRLHGRHALAGKQVRRTVRIDWQSRGRATAKRDSRRQRRDVYSYAQ